MLCEINTQKRNSQFIICRCTTRLAGSTNYSDRGTTGSIDESARGATGNINYITRGTTGSSNACNTHVTLQTGSTTGNKRISRRVVTSMKQLCKD